MSLDRVVKLGRLTPRSHIQTTLIEGGCHSVVGRETARIGFFVIRYGITRAIMDGLARRGMVRKYKFGCGRSGPIVYSVSDMEKYMKDFEGKRNGA